VGVRSLASSRCLFELFSAKIDACSCELAVCIIFWRLESDIIIGCIRMSNSWHHDAAFVDDFLFVVGLILTDYSWMIIPAFLILAELVPDLITADSLHSRARFWYTGRFHFPEVLFMSWIMVIPCRIDCMQRRLWFVLHMRLVWQWHFIWPALRASVRSRTTAWVPSFALLIRKIADFEKWNHARRSTFVFFRNALFGLDSFACAVTYGDVVQQLLWEDHRIFDGKSRDFPLHQISGYLAAMWKDVLSVFVFVSLPFMSTEKEPLSCIESS